MPAPTRTQWGDERHCDGTVTDTVCRASSTFGTSPSQVTSTRLLPLVRVTWSEVASWLSVTSYRWAALVTRDDRNQRPARSRSCTVPLRRCAPYLAVRCPM